MRVQLAGLLGAVAALVLAGCSDSKGTSSGPLHVFARHGYVVPAEAGRVFTDGFDVVRLNGGQPARVLKVESVGGTDVLDFMGAQIVGPKRKYGATQIFNEYPPQDRSLGEIVPAVGAVLQPRAETGIEGYELLLGYRIRAGALGARTGIRITYEVNGKTFETTIEAAIITCPAGQSSATCQREATGTRSE
jgi:hypothetical protein